MDIVTWNDDLELLHAWRSGDNRAGKELFSRNRSVLSRFFQNKLSHGDDAADLIQETFVALIQSRDGKPKNVRHYLLGIARIVLLAYLRKKYKRANEQLDFGVACVKELDPASLSSIVTGKRELQALVEGLRSLPLEEQILLEYRYIEGLSHSEIAEVLEVPETTIPGRLQRARDRLRRMISKHLSGQHDYLAPDEEFERWARELRSSLGATSKHTSKKDPS